MPLPSPSLVALSRDAIGNDVTTRIYLTCLSLAPTSASVSSDYMALYKSCIIITIIGLITKKAPKVGSRAAVAVLRKLV